MAALVFDCSTLDGGGGLEGRRDSRKIQPTGMNLLCRYGTESTSDIHLEPNHMMANGRERAHHQTASTLVYGEPDEKRE